MTAADQLQMFEPEGAQLVELVQKHLARAQRAERIGSVLHETGYSAAASNTRGVMQAAYEAAFTCEMAAQFEQLAELV